jgi:hypothetical protein
VRTNDDGNDLTKEISPVGDRWAQIRKNAAERAAQRQSEEQSRGGQSQKTDGDDGETSGEESESIASSLPFPLLPFKRKLTCNSHRIPRRQN